MTLLITHITKRYKGANERIDQKIDEFNNLTYATAEKSEENDDIPFY